MHSARRCFAFRSAEGEEADLEEANSSSKDFRQHSNIPEAERRRLLVDYLEDLRRAPLREMQAEVCRSSERRRPATGVRRSKKAVRRSSALVKSRRTTSDENSCLCSGSVTPEFPCCQSKMNGVRCCGGSILRGGPRAAGTQTSRSQSVDSFHTYSRTKGPRNCRGFPPLAKISNRTCIDRLPSYATPSSEKCACFTNTNIKKAPKNYHDFFPRSNDCVITTASTSEEDVVDYQVPVEPCVSSHRLYETESGTKTLVPTSSHVTIRICSRNSSSNLRLDRSFVEEGDRQCSSGSENSVNHVEDRVRRGLRDVSCCEDREDGNFPRRLENDGFSFKPGYSHCQDSSSIPNPRSEKTSCCCNCRGEYSPTIGFEESSDEGMFQRFKDVLTETRTRRGPRRTSRFHSRPKKNLFKSDRVTCTPKSREIVNRPRRMLRKRPSRAVMIPCNKIETRNSSSDSLIVLSARKYKEFCDRCESIRKSMRTTKEASVWKGDSLNLRDLAPDLPPLNHWSQYEEGMRRVANEYRTLKSCVNLVESEAMTKDTSCRCTEKSVTRTYPSGTEFTFRVKRAPEKEGGAGQTFCGKKSASTQMGENFAGTGRRSVCFEKSKREKQPCCDCLEEVDTPDVEAIATREADLLKTLESFCEKMKTMKSEFEKSASKGCPGSTKAPGICRSCGRGPKGTGFNKLKAKKLLIFPPEGENGPPLTLRKNSSSINCRVKGDQASGFRYHVVYIQRFVSSTWNPEKETHRCCVDSG